jgi:hypothetical protein
MSARDESPAWAAPPAVPANWDLRLLIERFDLLMERREAICAWAPWCDIEVVGCRASLAYIGGGPFALGGLLRAWADGTLAVKAGGRTAYVYNVSGSVLSGRGGAHAFDPSAGAVARVGSPGEWAPRAQARSLAPRRESAWSLGQLLAAWGVRVPDIELRDDGRAALGRYAHDEAALFDADGRCVSRFVFPSPDDVVPIEPSWRGVEGELPVSVGRVELTRTRPAQRRVTLDGPLPPCVAPFAAKWLCESGLL